MSISWMDNSTLMTKKLSMKKTPRKIWNKIKIDQKDKEGDLEKLKSLMMI